MTKGIDISHWQKKVDFRVLKEEDQIDFCILKAGGSDKGFYVDSTFYPRYEECKRYNINVGAYYFVGSKCDSAADGYADAIRFLHIIDKLKFEYPVFIDFEAPDSSNVAGNTDSVIEFCMTMEDNGYYVGIYASDISGFKDRLQLDRLQSFDKWVARYGKEPEYVKKYGIWQCSSKGLFEGIPGQHVDCDVSFKDYASIMKKRGLNGF